MRRGRKRTLHVIAGRFYRSGERNCDISGGRCFRRPLSWACTSSARIERSWRGEQDRLREEWKALEKGVTGAGMLVSVSDRDFTDTFGEASALAAKALAARRDDASDLVRQLAKTRGTRFGLTTSAQEVETETLASLRSSRRGPHGQGAR